MFILIFTYLVGCTTPSKEFTCHCSNNFVFGSESEVEDYSELFYCYEDEEANAWVDEEIQLCEEYAQDADVFGCDCTCDEEEAC